MTEPPLALFLTWTTYGCWLPGDARGWSKRGRRGLPADAARERAAQWRMTEDACVLSTGQRRIVSATIEAHCDIRGWTLHAIAVRSNHVYVVVTAMNVEPSEVRRQFKAWTTRRLREATRNRKNWWTEGGDVEFLDSPEAVAEATEYVLTAQDRKGRDAD